MSLMLGRAGLVAAGAAPVTLAELELLRTDLTTNGAQLVDKTFGVDAAPTGVTVSSTAVTVTSAFSGELVGWDFGARQLIVNADAVVTNLENFTFTSAGIDSTYNRFIEALGRVDRIAWGTFKGHAAHTALTSAINNPNGHFILYERNRHLDFFTDVMKPAHGLVRDCYFGATFHAPVGTVDYNPATTYARGGFALSEGAVAISLQDGNTGNAPPAPSSQTVSNDFWIRVMPHVDNITVGISVGSGVVIDRCLIDNGVDPALTVPGATASIAFDTNNALRIVRNTGDSSAFGPVTISNTAWRRARVAMTSAVLDIYDGLLPGFNGPIRFINCFASDRGTSPTGGYFHPNADGRVDVWSNVVDYFTGDPVTGPTLRVLAAPVNTEAPAITGTAAVGEELTVSNGTWTGQPIPSFSYQWTSDGEDIAGATAATFTVTGDEDGTTVAARVTGTNNQGAASATAAGVSISTPTFGTDITLDAFALASGGALPVFTGQRGLNTGWVPVSGSGEPGAAIQGRMVGGAGDSALVPVVDAAGDPVLCDAVTGDFAGYIAGGQRSLIAYKAQVSYIGAGNAPAETANSCYIGRVFSVWSQSDHRWLGRSSGTTGGAPPQVASTDNRVRFVTLDRDPDGLVPADAGDLLAFDIAGTSPAGREPMWAMGNALMSFYPGERIVVSCHAVSGSTDFNVVNDNATHEAGSARIWADEVLTAAAAQPHLTEITGPAAYDAAIWAWSTGTPYAGSSFVDIVGPQLVPFLSDGTPVTRGAQLTVGSRTWDADHFWSDIYDLARTKVAFREHYLPTIVAGQEMFEGHAVYGGIVAGFPVSFSRTSVERGSDAGGGVWGDQSHGSTATREGQVRDAEIVAAHIAHVLGDFDPGTFGYDYIHWPDDVADDERYVYIGIVGRDVTTLRYLGDPLEAPGAFGQVTHFTINGAITQDVTIVTFEGQQRFRLQKPAEAEWNGSDVIGIVDTGAGAIVADVGYSPSAADYFTRYTLDAPVVEVPVPGLQALPITTRVGPTFFDNPLPPPPSAALVWLDDFTGTSTITTATTIMTLTSTGAPILIALGTRSANTNATLGFPQTLTLGGVDILPNLVGEIGASRTKGGVYFIPAPAVGSLDLVVSYDGAEGGLQNVAQAFHVTGGAGIGPTPVTFAASSNADDTTAATGTATGSLLVKATFSSVLVVSAADIAILPDAAGGRVSAALPGFGVALTIASKIVGIGGTGGSFAFDGSTVGRATISFEVLPA